MTTRAATRAAAAAKAKADALAKLAREEERVEEPASVDKEEEQEEQNREEEQAESEDNDSENCDGNEDDEGGDDNLEEDEGDEEEEEEEGDVDRDSDGSDGVGEADEFPVEDDDEEPEEELEAVGFGDAMSKILQQNVASDAQPILAKRTTARMREIMNEKKEIKKERVGAAEKRAKERKDNVVPSVLTAAKDRQLRKIATKGVVALFNAIAKHQHQVSKVEDKDDKKVKELSKENFLGLLKSGATQKDTGASTTAKTEPAKSSWSVLQDDYMMGAKLKDWDATHSKDAGRRRKAEKADDDSDPEAEEDKAWKQVAALDSDDETKPASKRASSGKPQQQKKKVKRS